MRPFWTLLIVLFLIQCSEQSERKIVDSWANGNPKKEVTFLGGNSTIQTFYRTGSIEKEQHYEKGKKSGLWTSYYEAGNLWSEHHYTNGVQVGPYRTWHPNGELFIDGNYNNLGKPEGNWIITDEKGEVLRSVSGEDIRP